MAKTGSLLYRERFTASALRTLYEEKISLSRAIGRDGTSHESFRERLEDELSVVLRKVDAGTYRFTTYKERLISKGVGRAPRVLSIPTIRDRLTLRVVTDIVSEIFSDARILRPHVYIKNIIKLFSEKPESKTPESNMFFIRIDVKDFYPSINHKILLKKIRKRIRKPQILRLIQAAVSTPTGRSDADGRGVPQGLSISNILSSIYLKSMDEKFTKTHMYYRYVDDILIICDKDSALSVFHEVQVELRRLYLTCHELGVRGKSYISPLGEGIEYLGFHITPLKISVRRSSYTRMIENILKVFTQYRNANEKSKSTSRFLWHLNLKITGCIYNNNRFGWDFSFLKLPTCNN